MDEELVYSTVLEKSVFLIVEVSSALAPTMLAHISWAFLRSVSVGVFEAVFWATEALSGRFFVFFSVVSHITNTNPVNKRERLNAIKVLCARDD